MKRECSKPKLSWGRCVSWTLALVLMPGVLLAQSTEIPWIEGPGAMDLGSQAEIYVDEGYLFADGGDDQTDHAECWETRCRSQELGLVAPASEDKSWILIFEFDSVGYVNDDDKDDIDADAILKSISDGTEEANTYRVEQGFSPIHVVGWSEEPRYDTLTNNLVWAVTGKERRRWPVGQLQCPASGTARLYVGYIGHRPFDARRGQDRSGTAARWVSVRRGKALRRVP